MQCNADLGIKGHIGARTSPELMMPEGSYCLRSLVCFLKVHFSERAPFFITEDSITARGIYVSPRREFNGMERETHQVKLP